MMDHFEIQDRLSALVDGDLPPDEQAEVERHLAGCEECRLEVAALQALGSEARALPRGIAPSRDLWPGIAARIGATATEPREPARVIPVDFRRTMRLQWVRLAAAAVVLVVVSSGLTVHLMRAGGTAPVAVAPAAVVPPPARATSALVAFRPAEVEYLGAVEALTVELEARRHHLAPETVATIEENLRIIDAAIAEARAALEADPGNADLPLHLSGVYRAKVELLQKAIQLPAST